MLPVLPAALSAFHSAPHSFCRARIAAVPSFGLSLATAGACLGAVAAETGAAGLEAAAAGAAGGGAAGATAAGVAGAAAAPVLHLTT